jgi:DNA-binding winged helix-turn-helix (wHTH) protein
MNTANVIPLGAPRSIPSPKSRHLAATNPVCIRFGAFELDERNARLLRDGKAVTLPPKPFEVLCALVRSPGCLVTKNALLEMVWGHCFVTESALKTAISEVRAALDDDPKHPRLIETVSRRGYRFIATTVDSPMQRAPAVDPNGMTGNDHPAVTALKTLCHRDAALAELIRSVAAAL